MRHQPFSEIRQGEDSNNSVTQMRCQVTQMLLLLCVLHFSVTLCNRFYVLGSEISVGSDKRHTMYTFSLEPHWTIRPLLAMLCICLWQKWQIFTCRSFCIFCQVLLKFWKASDVFRSFPIFTYFSRGLLKSNRPLSPNMWRHQRIRTLLRNKYHRPWSDAAHDARRLIRAYGICH